MRVAQRTDTNTADTAVAGSTTVKPSFARPISCNTRKVKNPVATISVAFIENPPRPVRCGGCPRLY